MNVLILFERSGVVRRAFQSRGHNAWSCDLAPAEDGSEQHFQDDAVRVMMDGSFSWDLWIAHPDCTYLSVSGLHWNKRRPGREQETEKALDLVRFIFNTAKNRGIRLALENPVSCISTRIRKPDQIIQPFEFGDDASKKTCLWLQNLPKLRIDPSDYVRPSYGCARCGIRFSYDLGKYGCPGCHGEKPARFIWANQTPSGQNKLGPSPQRAMERARTYPGIANAFAEQWGRLNWLPHFRH